MGVILKNLCEIHSLGATTREWLVGVRQVPRFRSTHTRVVGYTEARSGYEFVRHNPVFSQVLACTGGEGEVLVDGEWVPCPAGFAYLTAPRGLCAYHARPGKQWKVCWVIYEESVRMPSLEAGRSPRIVRTDTRSLHLPIEGLCHDVGGGGEPADLEFWAALVHRKVLRILQPGDGDPRFNHLWSSVHEEIGAEWDLRRLANCAGMSEESLRRVCQRQAGRPPLAHLTHLRMLFAADLLACSQEKIASVATRVGYSDAFAFSNAFKREMGEPPSRYRTLRQTAR